MKISEIRVKDKKPFRAYFNRIPIWWKYHERTQAIFDYANERYYQLPTNKLAYDDLVRGLVGEALFHSQMDVLYNQAGDGDVNFKLVNMLNPGTYNGTALGGLEWSNEGVKGNGVNGYIDTNFDPSLLAEGQKYQLNDASRGGSVTSDAGYAWLDSTSGNNNTTYLSSSGSTANRINATGTFIGGGIPTHIGGFQYIGRPNSGIIEIVRRNTLYEREKQSESLPNDTYKIFNNGSMYAANMKVQFYFVGASIAYEQTQVFREIYNKYLTAIGLEPIA